MIEEPTKRRKGSQFYHHAIADKILIARKILCYVPFFEADEPFIAPPTPWTLRCSVFQTRNGFHAIGTEFLDGAGKREWYEDWKEVYPSTDYRLQNINWLAPASRLELNFIMALRGTSPDLGCAFYRDKAVFETWEGNHHAR